MDLMSLVARLGIDKSDYDAGLDEAISDAESKGSSIGNNISKGFSVGIKAIGMATTAVTGFGMSAVKTGEGFDKSMSQVYATMGNVDSLSQESMESLKAYATELGVAFDETTDLTKLSQEALRAYAQEMGSKTSFSASQAADALNYMALAGYDAATSMEMLPNVLNLAAAGGIELATASDMVTDAQSALGLDLEQTTALVDQMAMASSKSNTNVAQLGEAMLTIGATARNMKGGTVELSTVLGVLADNGIKGAEGGTHLRNAILSLQTPTKSGTEALAKLGMTYEEMYDSAGNMRALPEIFLELQERMEGMDQASKDAIISGIFNKTDLAAINALIGTEAERWDELTASIENSVGAADQMQATQLDNLAGDITLLKSAFEGVQIAISDELTPGLRDFVKFGADGLSRLTEAFKEGGIGGAMAVFGDLLSEGLAMIVDKLPTVVDAGAQLIGALGQGLIDNLPTLTSAAVEIVSSLSKRIVEALPIVTQAGIDLLTELVSGLTDAVPSLITDIADVISRIAEVLTDPANITSLMRAGINLLQALVQGLLDALPILIDALPVVFENISDSLIQSLPILIDGVLSIVNAVVNKLPEIIKKISQSIPKIIQSVVKALTSALPELIRGVVSLVNALVQALPEIIKSLIEAIPDIISAVVQALVTSLPLLIDGLVQLMVALVQALPEVMKIMTEAIPEVLNMVINALLENLPVLIEGIITMQMALWEHLPEIMKALFDVIPTMLSTFVQQLTVNLPILISGISKMFVTISASVVNGAASIFTQVTTAIKNWWGKQKSDIEGGVSQFITDFKKWVEDLPYNLGVVCGDMINKFVEWKDKALNWIKTNLPIIINSICDWFLTLPDKIWEAFTSTVNNFKNFASFMIQTVKEEIPKIIDKIVEFFSELPSKAYEWGKDMIESFKNGITSKVDEALNAVSNFAKGIKSRLGHSHPTEGVLADDYTWMPDMMDLFAEGINDNSDKVYKAIENAFDFSDVTMSTSDIGVSASGGNRGLITPTTGRDVTVILQLNEEQLGKTTFRLYNDEEQRVGVDLGKAVYS